MPLSAILRTLKIYGRLSGMFFLASCLIYHLFLRHSLLPTASVSLPALFLTCERLLKSPFFYRRIHSRPFQLFPVTVLVLECRVYSNFYNFLVGHSLLSDLQFGLRWFCSCELATVKMADNILSNIDQDLLSGLLLIDLKKAFDLVNQRILLVKLKTYGCSASALQLLTSYKFQGGSI